MNDFKEGRGWDEGGACLKNRSNTRSTASPVAK